MQNVQGVARPPVGRPGAFGERSQHRIPILLRPASAPVITFRARSNHLLEHPARRRRIAGPPVRRADRAVRGRAQFHHHFRLDAFEQGRDVFGRGVGKGHERRDRIRVQRNVRVEHRVQELVGASNVRHGRIIVGGMSVLLLATFLIGGGCGDVVGRPPPIPRGRRLVRLGVPAEQNVEMPGPRGRTTAAAASIGGSFSMRYARTLLPPRPILLARHMRRPRHVHASMICPPRRRRRRRRRPQEERSEYPVRELHLPRTHDGVQVRLERRRYHAAVPRPSPCVLVVKLPQYRHYIVLPSRVDEGPEHEVDRVPIHAAPLVLRKSIDQRDRAVLVVAGERGAYPGVVRQDVRSDVPSLHRAEAARHHRLCKVFSVMVVVVATIAVVPPVAIIVLRPFRALRCGVQHGIVRVHVRIGPECESPAGRVALQQVEGLVQVPFRGGRRGREDRGGCVGRTGAIVVLLRPRLEAGEIEQLSHHHHLVHVVIPLDDRRGIVPGRARGGGRERRPVRRGVAQRGDVRVERHYVHRGVGGAHVNVVPPLPPPTVRPATRPRQIREKTLHSIHPPVPPERVHNGRVRHGRRDDRRSSLLVVVVCARQ
mmetsp:Transcript_18029/g.43322  ORF Transcript_18029/g.43322 Transcript_18029/m.43322 type:complete len:597 (+) Transcript_18029:262-2052(+)